MKSSIPCLFVALAMAGAVRADENFIMQEVVSNNQTIQYKIPLSNTSGEVMSYPVDATSSIFRLYTIYTDSSNTLKTLLLDTKSVGTYMPSAKVTVSSSDPFVPARTRVDQPYGISIVASGLSSEAGAPEQGKTMRVVRSYKVYDPKTMAAASGDKGKDYTNPFTLDKNTTYSLTDGNSAGGFQPRLDIADNPQTALMGEETFTVYTGGSTSTASTLASGTIQIWPIAESKFYNLEPKKIYRDVPVGSSIGCVNLYPGCRIYAQIYKGDPTNKLSEAKVIPSADLQYSATTREPQTQIFPLNNLENFIFNDGDYTIEIMTVTPFNGGKPELISGGTLTFGVKRSISVNSGINTIEGG